MFISSRATVLATTATVIAIGFVAGLLIWRMEIRSEWASAATAATAATNSNERPGDSPDLGHPLRVGLEPARRAPYIDIPAVVVRPNGRTLRPYFAMRARLTVRYLGNIFSTNEPELLWVPAVENGMERLMWQTFQPGKGGLIGVYQGQELKLLDDKLYDLDVGTLFVKVQTGEFPPAYMLLETLIGETEPASNDLLVAKDPLRFLQHASVVYQGIRLYEQGVVTDIEALKDEIKLLQHDAGYANSLSAGQPGGIHPLFAMSTARSTLFTALNPEVSEELRETTVAAIEHFVDKYVEPAKIDTGGGMISWPYNFPWVLNWGIKLSPPWYSPYVNAQAISMLSLLYRLTGKERYKALAHEAMPFIVTPITKGGSEYDIQGFRLPAEYVYATPPLPNVRVLDGELGVAIGLYNSARLLGDSEMLRQSTAYFASIAMNMESYLKEDGGLWFSQYVENMPEGYEWAMWALLQNAATITKDRRFTEMRDA